MTDQQLNSYRTLLREISSRTRIDVDAVREQALGPVGGQGEGALSNPPMHLGDLGTETQLQELNATLLENEEYMLAEVLEAIRRIDDGSYGHCESCREPIASARLDALPATRHCVTCAEEIRPGPGVNLDATRPAPALKSNRARSASQPAKRPRP